MRFFRNKENVSESGVYPVDVPEDGGVKVRGAFPMAARPRSQRLGPPGLQLRGSRRVRRVAQPPGCRVDAERAQALVQFLLHLSLATVERPL